MKTYKVNFYKKTQEGQEFLGQVVVDDTGVDDVNMTIMSKAFRQATSDLLRADIVQVQKF